MKIRLLVIVFFICSIQMSYPQEDNTAVSLNLPVRNSLTFNRYNINPTFSFVREQNKYISIFNKREWVQFEDAPLTYLASYTGRLAENIGAGVGVFQQNNGVLTTFGGVVNFAYNARLASESNLTFGMNIGAYKSGVNNGRITRSIDDPSLQNIPENFMFTLNPGINYGVAYFDFGVAVNNLVVYNMDTSALDQNTNERGVQAHLMYTGYMNSRGFLDESKFSGLVRSEFREDDTVISGIAMLTVPKGIWAQVGYNTLYGVSGGLGMNITAQIAIEYNFEKAIGDLTEFGPSHDITLAFRFKNRERYDYSSGDEIVGLISGTGNKKKHPATKISDEKAEENRKKAAERRLRIQAERELAQETKALEEQKAKESTNNKDEAIDEEIAIVETEEQTEAEALEIQKAKEEAAAKIKAQEEQKAKEKAEARQKALEAQKAKEEAEAKAKAKAIEEQKAKEEAKAIQKALEEQQAKEVAEAAQNALDEQKAKEDAEVLAEELEQAKALDEQKAKDEAEARILAEQRRLDSIAANAEGELNKSMYDLSQQVEASKTKQDELLEQFKDIIDIKNDDLIDLKEENDLSEQGIVVTPKPFKSVTEENNRLRAVIAELDNIIETRNKQIKDLKKLYEETEEVGTIYLDEITVYYKKTLERLTAEQIEATQAKIKLQLRLDDINVATEFERNRRIKRAAFDNEEDRYENDQNTLKTIKENTAIGSTNYQEADFDFGEIQSGNIKIMQNVEHVENGYYVVIAVHNDVAKRNEFVTKVFASGQAKVNFFYDVNSSKYYIYYDKFTNIEAANKALQLKGTQPYNTNMSLVKIEN